MKKTLFVVFASLTGAVFSAPVMANGPFSGVCTFNGTATFTDASNNPANLTPTSTLLTYHFTSNSGTCSGLLGTTPVTLAASTASADGTGMLSCAASTSTSGTGTLSVGGTPIGFGISLVAAGTEVSFVLTGNAGLGTGGVATGHASFALDTAGAAACTTAIGASSLNFTLVATATALSD